jgi:hypothetical protein
MKKLPGLLLLIFIAFQPGCKKSNGTQAGTNAHLIYGGNPAADGIGYYIQLDDTHENVWALNLPSGFKDPGGRNANEAVSIKFVDTGKRQLPGNGPAGEGGWRVVYLVTIARP